MSGIDAGGVAVVTGGASGIGLALALAAGERVDHVVIADVDEGSMTRAVETLAAAGFGASAHRVDLRDRDGVAELARVAGSLGTVRIVCMNAGVTSTGPTIWETPPAQLDFLFDVNVGGLVNCLAAFVPVLVGQAESSGIIITASMAGLVASPGSAAYAASKAAAVAIAKASAGELAAAAPQVTVTLLCPGMVKTNLLRTSAATQPQESAMSADLVAASHDALNSMGLEPAVVARAALTAMDAGEFWALPPPGDLFTNMLVDELEQLDHSLRGGPPQ